MFPFEHVQKNLDSCLLAELFESCIKRYSELLFALGDDHCRTVELKQTSIEKALDGYGRLKIWGEQNRAGLPASTRGSLDDSLRRDETLKSNVAQILGLLTRQVEAATEIASGKTWDAVETEPSATSDSSSESDSSNSSPVSDDIDILDKRQGGRVRTSKIAILLSHIQEQTELLYHLDALLRRPRLSGRYLRSTDKNYKSSPIEKHDYSHIVEKHRQWTAVFNSDIEQQDETQPEIIPLQSSQTRPHNESDDEPAVSQDELTQRESRQEKDETHTIISRLARANSRRRQQLSYWEIHPVTGNIEEETFGTEKPKTKSLMSSSGDRFSSVARSAIDETDMDARRTVYPCSVTAGRKSARVPDVPKEAFTEEQVECPFCHAMLDSGTMKTRMSWKRHVFRDLRPYTCTYDGCSNPDKMYATRHDWIYHEMQMHRRQWECRPCEMRYSTKASMADHLKTNHSGISTGQSTILLEMSERPLDDGHYMKCTLCPSQMTLSRFFEHLAEHMEEIALFSLPSFIDEDDDTASNAARLSRGQENSDKHIKTPASSLHLSEIDCDASPQGNTEELAELVRSKDPHIESESTAPGIADSGRMAEKSEKAQQQSMPPENSVREGTKSSGSKGTRTKNSGKMGTVSRWRCCHCHCGLFDLATDLVCPVCHIGRCSGCRVC